MVCHSQFIDVFIAGMKLAQAAVFLSCAMSLAVFNISHAKDEDGNNIEPQIEYTSGLVRYADSTLGVHESNDGVSFSAAIRRTSNTPSSRVPLSRRLSSNL